MESQRSWILTALSTAASEQRSCQAWLLLLVQGEHQISYGYGYSSHTKSERDDLPTPTPG